MTVHCANRHQKMAKMLPSARLHLLVVSLALVQFFPIFHQQDWLKMEHHLGCPSQLIDDLVWSKFANNKMFATLGLLQANCAAVRLLLENSVWVSVIQSGLVGEWMSVQDARWCKCSWTISYNFPTTIALTVMLWPAHLSPTRQSPMIAVWPLTTESWVPQYHRAASSERAWRGPPEVPFAIGVVLQLGAVSWTLAGGMLRTRWHRCVGH